MATKKELLEKIEHLKKELKWATESAQSHCDNFNALTQETKCLKSEARQAKDASIRDRRRLNALIKEYNVQHHELSIIDIAAAVRDKENND